MPIPWIADEARAVAPVSELWHRFPTGANQDEPQGFQLSSHGLPVRAGVACPSLKARAWRPCGMCWNVLD